MRRRILVVKGVSDVCASLKEVVEKQAFDFVLVEDLTYVLRALRDHRPALILFNVLTWNVPLAELLWDMSELRSARGVRKIILAAKGSSEEKVAALELGADDFLVSPISARELEARVAATLRTYRASEGQEDIQVMGTMCLDRETMALSIKGVPVVLTSREFHLLAYMMNHQGEVLSRGELLHNIWPPEGAIEGTRIIDVYICRLRDKIEEDPSDPRILLTRRGEGYSLIAPAIHP